MTPVDPNAPCPCGSTKKYKHCCLRKDKAAASKLSSQMSAMQTLLVQARQHMAAGRFAQAKLLAEQILQLDPAHADAVQLLSICWLQMGQGERAADLLQRAIQAIPQSALLHATLGNIFLALGKTSSAINSLLAAIAIRPDFVEALSNLGNVYLAAGDAGKALVQYQAAIQLRPEAPDLHNNMGTALQALDRLDDAEQAYRKALQLQPKYPQALCNMAALLQQQEPDRAVQFVRKAIGLAPNYYEAWVILAKILQPQGLVAEASAAFNKALQLRPTSGLQIASALLLPTIMGSKQEVADSRRNFELRLDQLASQGVRLMDPVKEYCSTNFLLAYQAYNDRDIQQRIARYYLQACPTLSYIAPHVSSAGASNRVRKIGFFSRFIAKHSVSLSYSKLIEKLAGDNACDVVLISTHDPQAASVQDTYPDFAGKHVRVAMDLAAAREQISAMQLDVLAYLDIGMDPFSYFLAFSRLARSQCVFDGHPVTTGIPAIDYFLSSDIAEPENAQDHYSETLKRFPFGAYYFEKAQIPDRYKSRKELGMPEEANLYVCPMVLFKIHPDFDQTIVRILQMDPRANVVFFDDKKYSSWSGLLNARFDRSIPGTLRDRVLFLPWMTLPSDFLSMIKQANVVLDPYHFGLGTTAIATCTVGTPFVTKPGEFARGRYGYYYAKLLDVMECVAHTEEEYATRAVEIATNPEYRTQLTRRILANNSQLFGNEQGINEVKAFFLSL